MKRKFLWIIPVAALISAVCIAGWFLRRQEGVVMMEDPDRSAIVLITQQSDKCAYIYDENTRLVWENKEVQEQYDKDDRDISYFLTEQATVTITRGRKLSPEENPFPEETDQAYYAREVLVGDCWADHMGIRYLKPVIYLYPQGKTQVQVTLDVDGELTCTYPAYENGWNVTAYPDGTLEDSRGQSYNYLYWEGSGQPEYDFSQGFCIAGADTAAFLEDALAKLGLTRREANELIVYWLPLMQDNPYNLISFQKEAYTSNAELTISPAPDTLIRVFMAWKPLQEAVEIEPQILTAPQRSGFTAVEWGGTKAE